MLIGRRPFTCCVFFSVGVIQAQGFSGGMPIIKITLEIQDSFYWSRYGTAKGNWIYSQHGSGYMGKGRILGEGRISLNDHGGMISRGHSQKNPYMTTIPITAGTMLSI